MLIRADAIVLRYLWTPRNILQSLLRERLHHRQEEEIPDIVCKSVYNSVIYNPRVDFEHLCTDILRDHDSDVFGGISTHGYVLSVLQDRASFLIRGSYQPLPYVARLRLASG